MKKLIVILSVLVLPFFVKAQCGPYTSSSPISLTAQSFQVIRGVSIDGGGGGVIPIALTDCHDIRITGSNITNSGQTVGISLYNCYNITIDSCVITSVGAGVYAQNCPKGGIKIIANYFSNMHRTLVGGQPTHGQMVQFNTVNTTNMVQSVVKFNRLEDFDGQSDPEDAISMFKSNGTSLQPIEISYNYIRRNVPISRTGGGILLGDNGGSWQVSHDNVLVSPGDYGIGIAGGDNMSQTSNKVYSPAHPGSTVANVAISYFNWTPGTNTCTNNTMSGNVVNWYSDRFPSVNNVFSGTGANACTPVQTGNTFGAAIDGTILPAVLAPVCTLVPVIAYSPAINIFIKGTAISSLTPTNTGGAPDAYSVSPGLPAGLSFDTSTGVISGTPTNVQTAANYTVTATNGAGSASFVVRITVNPAIPIISYLTPQIYIAGTAISVLNPSSTGGPVTSYSVSPVLPSGLILNPASGAISGTPVITSPATAYTVTASNITGTGTKVITITVRPALPSIIYAPSTNNYTYGSTIVPLSPVNLGGVTTSYAINTALPSGLSFNTSTGVISGTPVAATATATYTVTATNTSGTGTANVIITVNPATLIIVANTQQKPQGTANPTLTYTISGWVHGDSPAVFTTGVSISTTAITGSSIGSYPITASAAVAPNYNIVFIDGVLIVTGTGVYKLNHRFKLYPFS